LKGRNFSRRDSLRMIYGAAGQFAEKLRDQRLAALKGRGFSRASIVVRWFTARLESRALSKARRQEFFRIVSPQFADGVIL